MVRAPCCEKMGLKKGPWTPEEDQILINYIQQYGHGNWRALPKHAGLLRCGKSCRLRWTNYLRPDIKRGNFTREEEDTIIKLHEMLGNRWSAIAARLPGRTDNEIKNVWHTHLKKRLKQNPVGIPEIKRRSIDMISRVDPESKTEPELVNLSNLVGFESCEGIEYRPISPQQCSSSEISSVTTGDDAINNMSSMKVEPSDDFLEMDENFWSEVLSSDNSSSESDILGAAQFQIPFSTLGNAMEPAVQYGYNSSMYDSMEFWYTFSQELGNH
ncbi:hypothetical protein P3X46_011747 [Hevea brasiliensis]|uniref:Myb-like domain-containing protein n=1 Tax=Hevea brasiliensis TaxID=3981 RepID=A0ABQ9M838_HEVBR|nr:transcription factor MYB14 [Hevea brasiliensis]KAJ9176437.1 hypothetical protein P3X46_011747 [Hevea brasiliensis]